MSRDSKLYLAKNDFTAGVPLKPFEATVAIRKAPKGWLTSTEKLVLYALASRGEEIYPSLNTLASDTSLCRRSVASTIQKLKDKGWLVVASGSYTTSNEYQVAVPKSVQRVATTSKSGNQYLDFIFPSATDAPHNSMGSAGDALGSAGDALGVVQEMHSKYKEEVKREVKRLPAQAKLSLEQVENSAATSTLESFSERSELKEETKQGSASPALPMIRRRKKYTDEKWNVDRSGRV